MPAKAKSPVSLFISKILFSETCWIWTGTIKDNGYPMFGRYGYAHRYAYQLWNGPLIEGLQVDHQCHNLDKACVAGNACLHRRCVNPDHLRQVEGMVNASAGSSSRPRLKYTNPPYNNRLSLTHCRRGHRLNAQNAMFYDRGRTIFRICVTCGVLRTWAQRRLGTAHAIQRYINRFGGCCDNHEEIDRIREAG